jgi:UMF1 family MFS transporter
MNETTGTPPGVANVATDANLAEVGDPKGLSKSALSWILHQGSRDPYVILVTIYIFAPYFSRVLVGDPVKGQAAVAEIAMAYGLITAATAPFLGASIEQYGPRKPFMLAILAVMIPLLLALWWAMPGGGLPIGLVGLFLTVLGITYNWGDVLNNSLLARASGPGQEPVLSGLGYALANALSVLTLIFMLWGFVLPGAVDWPGVPKAPLFGMSSSDHEPSRLSAPLAAVLMGLGAIPFFLWTKDAARTGATMLQSLRHGAKVLADTFGNLKGHQDVATYLGARMLYCDGMTALLIFGGLFAAGLMGWGELEMLAYGISLSIFGVLGGLIAPWFDRVLGPRRAVQLEIAGAMLVLIGTLGMGREKILFFWTYKAAEHAPVWNGPLFRTLPELIYLGLGLLVAVFVTAQYASSRTLLVRLAPADRMAAFFGLYALSGLATAWLGSMLVAAATKIFASQVAGFLPIVGLLLLGLIGLFFVNGGDKTA